MFAKDYIILWCLFHGFFMNFLFLFGGPVGWGQIEENLCRLPLIIVSFLELLLTPGQMQNNLCRLPGIIVGFLELPFPFGHSDLLFLYLPRQALQKAVLHTSPGHSDLLFLYLPRQALWKASCTLYHFPYRKYFLIISSITSLVSGLSIVS